MKLGFEGLLRSSEIRTLRKEHLIRTENGRWYVRAVGGKGRREDEIKVYLRDTDAKIERMWMILKKGCPDELIFPNWSAREANNIINDAAIEYKWDPKRIWSMHSLRHGKATDLKLRGVEPGERKSLGRWRSATAEQHYSRHPNQHNQ